MDKFLKHSGKAVALVREDIDTDQIMPKQFLTRIERSGFGAFVFYNWRFTNEGEPVADFPLNIQRNAGASILISGSNFGCGSSREHAPWGLLDFGFKVIVAENFADIFYNNCFKTGILPISIPREQIEILSARTESVEGYLITVDLKNQTLTDSIDFEFHFEIDPFRKLCLLQGLDDIGQTIRLESRIAQFEKKRSFGIN